MTASELPAHLQFERHERVHYRGNLFAGAVKPAVVLSQNRDPDSDDYGTVRIQTADNWVIPCTPRALQRLDGPPS
ncbi:hypothetical protein Psed_0859 [Pseudonocardia dioxanivorans CB1190]|uniref:Uncharacterized protein n=1 Tax=Pseudonocardia dioxanivorans (strain ATCC 55486 / DSM 44775 / JCM 13855 / CB1190) TaxID=675635 RepID=F4CSD9_PSEUX|nr:hypothetical protein [Pseudonocardia dioxanivorans]AEA23113.1 hypothetical protein Psed_0859 [Pseudonocardia dioxanivorans CB1190]